MISGMPGDMGFEGMHELGPDKMSGVSDQQMTLRAANQFLGSDRYPQHNERMIQMLESYDLLTPGIEMAVALHDVVDHGLINPKGGTQNVRAREFIGRLHEEVEDKDGFVYALGCAISTAYWEDQIGEGWRSAGPEAFSGKTVGERQQITAAIEHTPGFEIDEAVLKDAKPDEIEIDTSALRHAMQERDVEGLIIKAVELMDNLDNPPPNNPASTWRDCVEIIKCYAPALELFGFNDLANDIRGKALEYFYDEDEEVIEKAKAQHDLSVKHSEFINDAVDNVVAEALRDIPGADDLERRTRLISRLKSEGSIREKMHHEDYVQAQFVPDGIGYRLILPDDVTAEMIIEIGEKIKALFTEFAMDDTPTPDFLARHPIDDNPVDESIRESRDSGYSAYHLALQQIVEEDGQPVAVPLEIQIVTETQERMHTYAKASHVLYKSGTPPTAQVIDDLRQIELRAAHLKEKPLNQELNPHTWLSILQQAPELDTPIHRTYGLIESENSRIMIPHELAGADPSIFDEEGVEGDVIIPPTSLDEKTFFELIGLIEPSLKESEVISSALELLKKQTLEPRRNGKSALEGHLMPTAFHAGVMAALSAKHWDSANPSEYLETIIAEGLLHDIVEDTELSRASVAVRYGDRIGDSVYALTSPGIVKDEHWRRTFYSWKIEADQDAPFIKLPDRGQNHTTDLALLAIAKVRSDEEKKAISDYFKKTARYKEYIFTNPEIMPPEYINVYRSIKALEKSMLVV